MAAPSYNVNLSYTATQIYNPTFPATGIVANVTVTNVGSNLVYLGGAGVNQTTGMPLPPGPRGIKFVNQVSPIYAIEAVTLGTIVNTTATLAQATNLMHPGAASCPTSANQPVTMIPGSVIGIGNTVNSYNLEFVTVASSVSATVFTATLTYPHVGAEGIYASSLPVYGSVVQVSPTVQ